jgi:Zn finger protein HypA/HybF involved in hydrogenase expression
MKVEIKGYVKCLKCAWEGTAQDLIEEQNGELVKCPECEGIMIDFTNGKFIMQNIEA